MKKKKIVQKGKKVVAKGRNVSTKRKKKVRKIRYGRVLLYIVFPIVLLFLISSFVHFPIKNIYISGNSILSDQEIIELAGITDYPSIFEYSSYEMEKKIEKHKYIDKATVKKRFLKEVYIEIKENVPILYDLYSGKTIFSDGELYDGNSANCVLLNYTPSSYLDILKNGLIELDNDIRLRISEMQYVPNDVDDKRFLLTMNDGNYVYITLDKINLMNSYLEIIKNVDGKKGILYLDSGEYFEIKN